MLLSRLKSVLIIITALCLLPAAFAQVGSESIARDTIKMLRQHRSGNNSLKPRRTQSKGAPKRIFQLEKMARQQTQINNIAETETIKIQPETKTEIIPPEISTPIEIRKPAEAVPVESEVISISENADPGNILSLMPEKTLACLRVNRMDYTLGQLDLFLQGITPGPAGTSMIVRMQLAQLLNDPLIEGINTNGQFAIFALQASEQLNESGEPDIFAGLLLPVIDSTFFQKHQLSQQLAADYALVGIESPKSTEARENIVKLMQGTNLTSVLDSGQMEISSNAPIWIYLNTVDMANIALNSIDNLNSPQINESQRKQILDQSKTFEAFIKDTDNLTVQLSPSADMLIAEIDLGIIPDSNLAKKLNNELFNTDTANTDPMTQQIAAYINTAKVDPSASIDPAVKALKTSQQAELVLSVNTLEFVGTMITLSIQQAQQTGQMDQQQAMGAMMVNMMISGMASQVKSKIALAISSEADNIKIELAVPKEHVLELVKLGKSLSQPPQGPGANPSNGAIPGAGMMNFEIK